MPALEDPLSDPRPGWPAETPSVNQAPHPRNRGSIKDLLSGGLLQIFAALASFMYFPVLTRVLDGDRLGAWGMLMNYALLLGLCDMGLSVAVQRVAVTGDKDLTRKSLGFALASVTTFAPIGAGLVYLGLLNLPREWQPIAANIHQTAPFAIASGVVMAYALPFRSYLYTQGGVQRAAIGKLTGVFLQSLIIATGFFRPATLTLVGIASLVAAVVDLAICVVSARRFDSKLPLLPRFSTRNVPVLKWLYDGMGAMIVNVFDVLAGRVDVLILSERTSSKPALVGLYNYVSRLVEQPYLLTKQVLPSLTPRLGSVSERGEAVRTGTIIFTSLILTGMCALALDGRELMILVFGHKLFEFQEALPTLELVRMLLGAAFVIMSTYEVSSPMLTLGGRSSWTAAVPLFVGGATKYVISYFGAPRYGVWATAGGSIIAYTLAGVWTWVAARKVLGWTWGRVISVFFIPLMVGVLAGAVAYGLRSFSYNGWFQSIVACGLTCVTGLGTLVILLKKGGRLAHG